MSATPLVTCMTLCIAALTELGDTRSTALRDPGMWMNRVAREQIRKDARTLLPIHRAAAASQLKAAHAALALEPALLPDPSRPGTLPELPDWPDRSRACGRATSLMDLAEIVEVGAESFQDDFAYAASLTQWLRDYATLREEEAERGALPAETLACVA